MTEEKTIISPTYITVEGPIIFLAGPILGGPDWQKEAINYIRSKNPELNIASPRRQADEKKFSKNEYNKQVDWEHFYLQLAIENGVIMFWLAKEIKHRCDRSYAQTTRIELGEGAVLSRLTGAKVVVGIEDGFTGAKYIRKTLRRKYPYIPICDNLPQTCDLAVLFALT